MLSFKKGRPIAIIEGGEHNGKILRLDENGKKSDVDINPMLLLGEEYFRKNKKINVNDLEDILKSIENETPPKEKRLKDVYNDAMSKLQEHKGKEFRINKGKLVVLPNPNKREVGYVAGPSGAGKSTWCGDYMAGYKELYPDNDLIIFSRVDSDAALDDLEPTRIKIDEELLEDPINKEELSNSLVLFDDIDTITDKKLKDNITKLRDDILETGRHDNTYILNTSHQLMNYKNTRTQINEAHFTVFFPDVGSNYHINRYLKTYCGLSTGQIDKIMKLPTRWVCIYTHAPRYVVYEHGAYLLN